VEQDDTEAVVYEYEVKATVMGSWKSDGLMYSDVHKGSRCDDLLFNPKKMLEMNDGPWMIDYSEGHHIDREGWSYAPSRSHFQTDDGKGGNSSDGWNFYCRRRKWKPRG
jgi:hypothetical protein